MICVFNLVPKLFLIFTCVDQDPYSKYGSGFTNLLLYRFNLDPFPQSLLKIESSNILCVIKIADNNIFCLLRYRVANYIFCWSVINLRRIRRVRLAKCWRWPSRCWACCWPSWTRSRKELTSSWSGPGHSPAPSAQVDRYLLEVYEKGILCTLWTLFRATRITPAVVPKRCSIFKITFKNNFCWSENLNNKMARTNKGNDVQVPELLSDIYHTVQTVHCTVNIVR